ncbi:MAG: undecaprenyl-phosphate glucose phosphotransferase [Polyangia bacterium]|jgi:putative colanic acid biosynthesis UDP-glucose lipid carrier transferase
MGPSTNGSSGSLRRHEVWVSSLQRLSDATMVIGSQLLARWLYGESWGEQTFIVTVLGLLVFGFAAELTGLYRPYRTDSIRREIRDALVAWSAVPLALLAYWFFTKTSVQYSRVAAAAWFALAPLFLCGLRIVVRVGLRTLRARGHNTRRVAILGCTQDAERLAEALDELPWLGLALEGIYEDRTAKRRHIPKHPRCKILGTSEDLIKRCRQGELDVVYVALPMRAELRTAGILATLADTTVTVYLVADFLYYSLLRSHWSQVGGIPVVSVHNSPFEGVVGWVKRSEDLVLGTMILLVTALPMLAIAIAIRLSSPGPILFRQWRYGLCGKRIRILKFRTMTVCEDGDHIEQARRNDARVTRIGRFLRRTSLDEFPQFLQVLTGELSLVGPRPHAVAHNERYRSLIHGYMLRHMVKPGITGWAQVNGWRGETSDLEKMEERVRHDLEYIRNWNLLLDIKIIFLTIFGSKKSRNAY